MDLLRNCSCNFTRYNNVFIPLLKTHESTKIKRGFYVKENYQYLYITYVCVGVLSYVAPQFAKKFTCAPITAIRHFPYYYHTFPDCTVTSRQRVYTYSISIIFTMASYLSTIIFRHQLWSTSNPVRRTRRVDGKTINVSINCIEVEHNFFRNTFLGNAQGTFGL